MKKDRYSSLHQYIHNNLRKAREKAGMRQVDIAMRLNQPQSYVSKYESGERILDVIELKQVCDALGMSLTEFVSQIEEEIS